MSLLLGSWLLAALCALLGCAIGSFLNVVVYRVPSGMSVISPPSACPRCDNQIRERHNVPVLGWLWLRGRCHDCSEPISARYPLVEAGTGALFAGVALGVDESFTHLAVALILAAGGLALALIDIDCGRLPFGLTATIAGMLTAVLALSWIVASVTGTDTAWRVAPVVAGALISFGFYALVWLVTLGRGMGLGDVALAPVLGGVLGVFSLGASVAGLAAGFGLGAVVGVLVLARARRRGARSKAGTRFPFGPSMIAGALVAVFVGDALWTSYLGLFGLS